MSNTKVVLGFLAGAAVGAIAGILFAPDKGSSTRKKIAGKANELLDEIKETAEDATTKMKHKVASAASKE